jgi:hypothetical protein
MGPEMSIEKVHTVVVGAAITVTVHLIGADVALAAVAASLVLQSAPNYNED